MGLIKCLANVNSPVIFCCRYHWGLPFTEKLSHSPEVTLLRRGKAGRGPDPERLQGVYTTSLEAMTQGLRRCRVRSSGFTVFSLTLGHTHLGKSRFPKPACILCVQNRRARCPHLIEIP